MIPWSFPGCHGHWPGAFLYIGRVPLVRAGDVKYS